MNVASFTVYVNVAHLCVVVFVSFTNVEVCRQRVGGFLRVGGKPIV